MSSDNGFVLKQKPKWKSDYNEEEKTKKGGQPKEIADLIFGGSSNKQKEQTTYSQKDDPKKKNVKFDYNTMHEQKRVINRRATYSNLRNIIEPTKLPNWERQQLERENKNSFGSLTAVETKTAVSKVMNKNTRQILGFTALFASIWVLTLHLAITKDKIKEVKSTPEVASFETKKAKKKTAVAKAKKNTPIVINDYYTEAPAQIKKTKAQPALVEESYDLGSYKTSW